MPVVPGSDGVLEDLDDPELDGWIGTLLADKLREEVELLGALDTFDPAEFLDGWGAEFLYGAGTDGASFTLHSAGPDGIDQGGAGDDVPLP